MFAEMTGLTLSSILTTQLDKVILSKMLSLEKFGYYTLACVVANGLNMIIVPIFNAIFPRYSELATLRDDNALKQLYHTSTQLMALLILPVAMTLVFFSYEILLVWTGNSLTAQNTSPIVSILIIGTALNGLMVLPYVVHFNVLVTVVTRDDPRQLRVVEAFVIIILTNYY